MEKIYSFFWSEERGVTPILVSSIVDASDRGLQSTPLAIGLCVEYRSVQPEKICFRLNPAVREKINPIFYVAYLYIDMQENQGSAVWYVIFVNVVLWNTYLYVRLDAFN